MTKDIAGKTRKKDEQAYVYTDNKERKKVELI